MSWDESLNLLSDDLNWKVHPKRYQDKMQEQYAQKIGVHTPGMQMSDVYSLWSATNTVQMLSAHTRDKQETKKYLSLGQQARYWYAPRGKKEKEDSYGDSDLGVMIELHKQFVSMHKWKTKETPEDAAKLMQHIEHMDQMMDEIDRPIKKLLNHTKTGIKEGDKARFITAAKHARNFSDGTDETNHHQKPILHQLQANDLQKRRGASHHRLDRGYLGRQSGLQKSSHMDQRHQ